MERLLRHLKTRPMNLATDVFDTFVDVDGTLLEAHIGESEHKFFQLTGGDCEIEAATNSIKSNAANSMRFGVESKKKAVKYQFRISNAGAPFFGISFVNAYVRGSKNAAGHLALGTMSVEVTGGLSKTLGIKYADGLGDFIVVPTTGINITTDMRAVDATLVIELYEERFFLAYMTENPEEYLLYDTQQSPEVNLNLGNEFGVACTVNDSFNRVLAMSSGYV